MRSASGSRPCLPWTLPAPRSPCTGRGRAPRAAPGFPPPTTAAPGSGVALWAAAEVLLGAAARLSQAWRDSSCLSRRAEGRRLLFQPQEKRDALRVAFLLIVGLVPFTLAVLMFKCCVCIAVR